MTSEWPPSYLVMSKAMFGHMCAPTTTCMNMKFQEHGRGTLQLGQNGIRAMVSWFPRMIPSTPTQTIFWQAGWDLSHCSPIICFWDDLRDLSFGSFWGPAWFEYFIGPKHSRNSSILFGSRHMSMALIEVHRSTSIPGIHSYPAKTCSLCTHNCTSNRCGIKEKSSDMAVLHERNLEHPWN